MKEDRSVMDSIVSQLFAVFASLGAFGLLILGILDSSFLFMPLGNDLLIVALTAQNHKMLPFFAMMAATGSVLGCLLVDMVCRKGGEEGLEKVVSGRRLAYVKRRMSKSAGWALAFASLMPPPFPFTPFVAAAAALQYPRKKLLSVIAGTRFIRFCAVGFLAILFGRQIIRLALSPTFRAFIIGIVVIFIVGSAYSIYSWFKRF